MSRWRLGGNLRTVGAEGFGDPTEDEPGGPTRYQVRVRQLADERDSLILDYVGADWAWTEDGPAEP